MAFQIITPWLCLSLALGVGAPSLIHASPAPDDTAASPQSPTISIGLIIDTSAISPELQRQLEVVTTRVVEPALEEAGYQLTSGVVDLAVRVRFSLVESGSFRDHGIHFEFVQDDEIRPAVQWVLCNACGQSRLEEHLVGAMPELTRALDKATVSMAASEVAEPAFVEKPALEAPPRLIGPIGGAGIGVAALGLGAVVWGAVEWSRGRVYDQKFGLSDPHQTWTDHSPRGKVLLGVGLGGVAVGAAMLATDMVLRSKRRKHLKDTGLVVPLTSPDGLGLIWVRRF